MSPESVAAPLGQTAASIAMSTMQLIIAEGGAALSMARIASAAGVSRQTLYRHFADLDEVLLGVVQLIASHDHDFNAAVSAQESPTAQLEFFVRSVVAFDHGDGPSTTDLLAVLPQPARHALRDHERTTTDLLSSILQTGSEQGEFRSDLQPDRDARLMLGLIGVASPTDLERVLALIRQLTEPTDAKEDS